MIESFVECLSQFSLFIFTFSMEALGRKCFERMRGCEKNTRHEPVMGRGGTLVESKPFDRKASTGGSWVWIPL